MTFIDSRNILYKHQYGFRSKHATIHPIIHLLNNCALVNNWHPKQITAMILCDLSKVFDVISHSILLKKLEHCGLRGNIKNWLGTLQTDRCRCVIKQHPSYKKTAICSNWRVGQIFAHINDIAQRTESHILSFADNTTLFLSDSEPRLLLETANIEANKLFNWFCADSQKTKFIIIKPLKAKFEFSGLNLFINGIPLERIGKGYKEESTMFLGAIFEESLA